MKRASRGLFVLVIIGCTQAVPPAESLPEPARALDNALTRLRDVEALDKPYVDGSFIYYTRYESGRRLHCRRGVAPGSPEQVLLEGQRDSLGAFEVSPDERWLAYSTRGPGDRYVLRLRDLSTGDESEPIDGTDFAVAWDKNNTLYYTQLDAKDRPKKVFAVEPKAKKKLDRDARLVHEERDPNTEVLVAPVDDDAALFVKAPTRLLGYRLGAAKALEGLPGATSSTRGPRAGTKRVPTPGELGGAADVNMAPTADSLR